MDLVALTFDEALRASGTLLKPKTRNAVEAAYASRLAHWGNAAERSQMKGLSKAPKPKGTGKIATIETLCERSLAEDWHGPATIPGVRNALNKLMAWVASSHGITLLASIQQEHMREYALGLRKSQPKTARKDLSYLSSIFQCGIEYELLPGPNPCEGIPKVKRSERKRVAKTTESNKALTLEQLHQIDELMKTDPQFELYLLQRFTGARQQEVAGLRRCDFREINGFYCIAIEPHEGRGLGVDGQGGGIKTPQSVRLVPLPDVLRPLWEKFKGESKSPCFPKQDKERTYGENYRSRFHDKTRRRGLPSGTHSLRETLIQTLTVNDVREYTVRCITGKSMPMADYVHADLPKMKEAIDLYAKKMEPKEQYEY
jgi:integrase